MQGMLLSGPVYEDCFTLKNNFMDRKSLSYTEFREAWHQVGFNSIQELLSEKYARKAPILMDSVFLAGMKWLLTTPTSQLPPILCSLEQVTATSVPSQATPTLVPSEATPTSVPALATSTSVPSQATPTLVPYEATPTSVPALATPTSVPSQATPTLVSSEATPTSVPALATSISVSSQASLETTPISAELVEKLAGLYLLWSLFYIQPIKPRIPIRATPESWAEISEFHEYLTTSKLQDASFMLHQLKADSAFFMCYSQVPNCVPNSVILSRVPKRDLLGKWLPSSLPSSGNSSLANPVLASLQPRLQEYAQSKQKLSSILPSHLLHDSTLAQDLQKILNS